MKKANTNNIGSAGCSNITTNEIRIWFHPALFMQGMVASILKNLKTNTRRIVKGFAFDYLQAGFTPEYVADPGNFSLCPYGKAGDIIWVKESHYQYGKWVKDGTTKWDHGRCVKQATLFFLHYKANGWVQGRGKPLKDWNSAAQKWIITEKDGTFSGFSNTTNSGSSAYENGKRGTFQRQRTADDGPQVEQDINYSFQRFLEQGEAFTIANIETGYYDCLKRYGTQFTEEQVAELRAMAITEMHLKELQPTEPLTQAYMKKFAVLEHFKLMKANGHKEIFTK